jgi:hypothetical protein
VQSWSSLCRILLSQTFSGNSRIVFAVVNDPVEQGFILSMAHPAGNVTGFSFIDFPLSGGRFSCLSKWRRRVIRSFLSRGSHGKPG